MTREEELTYTPAREKELAQVVQDFHVIMYSSGVWRNMTYLGVPIFKNPLDLWVYQEIISETRPDVIIETGTSHGGSALYLAGILDAVNNGKVLSIDIAPENRPDHPRVTYYKGDSTSVQIKAMVVNELQHHNKVMAALDSDHRKSHVLKELAIYGPLVTPGQYLIIEDTNLNGHPVPFKASDEEEEGPFEAVREWTKLHPEFEQDYNRGKFGVTFNPGGYLRRKL